MDIKSKTAGSGCHFQTGKRQNSLKFRLTDRLIAHDSRTGCNPSRDLTYGSQSSIETSTTVNRSDVNGCQNGQQWRNNSDNKQSVTNIDSYTKRKKTNSETSQDDESNHACSYHDTCSCKEDIGDSDSDTSEGFPHTHSIQKSNGTSKNPVLDTVPYWCLNSKVCNTRNPDKDCEFTQLLDDAWITSDPDNDIPLPNLFRNRMSRNLNNSELRETDQLCESRVHKDLSVCESSKGVGFGIRQFEIVPVDAVAHGTEPKLNSVHELRGNDWIKWRKDVNDGLAWIQQQVNYLKQQDRSLMRQLFELGAVMRSERHSLNRHSIHLTSSPHSSPTQRHRQLQVLDWPSLPSVLPKAGENMTWSGRSPSLFKSASTGERNIINSVAGTVTLPRKLPISSLAFEERNAESSGDVRTCNDTRTLSGKNHASSTPDLGDVAATDSAHPRKLLSLKSTSYKNCEEFFV